jgi:hypothetical protein
MFDLFGTKKTRLIKSAALVRKCEDLLNLQIESLYGIDCGSRLHTLFAYGYIFGFADAVFIKERVSGAADRLGHIGALFYSLFGNGAGPKIFDQCMASSQQEEFVRGRLLGGQEIFDSFKSQVPSGLRTYLLDGGLSKQ